MHAVATGSSTCVEEEWDTFLIFVQYKIQVTVTEDHSSSKQSVCPMSRDFLETLKKSFIDSLRSELVDELVIIDSNWPALFVDSAGYIEWGNDLFFGVLLGSLRQRQSC